MSVLIRAQRSAMIWPNCAVNQWQVGIHLNTDNIRVKSFRVPPSNSIMGNLLSFQPVHTTICFICCLPLSPALHFPVIKTFWETDEPMPCLGKKKINPLAKQHVTAGVTGEHSQLWVPNKRTGVAGKLCSQIQREMS